MNTYIKSALVGFLLLFAFLRAQNQDQLFPMTQSRIPLPFCIRMHRQRVPNKLGRFWATTDTSPLPRLHPAFTVASTGIRRFTGTGPWLPSCANSPNLRIVGKYWRNSGKISPVKTLRRKWKCFSTNTTRILNARMVGRGC